VVERGGRAREVTNPKMRTVRETSIGEGKAVPAGE
jgi:hypothetical protein